MKSIYECFMTLLYSWGGDPPAEAIWAANDFLKHFSSTYPQLKDLEFNEDDVDGTNNQIMEIIKGL